VEEVDEVEIDVEEGNVVETVEEYYDIVAEVETVVLVVE